MSTTETHYSDNGTWLDADNPAANYDGTATLRIGQQCSGGFSGCSSDTERANVILRFDVSDLDPTTIVKSVLKFTASGLGASMYGNTVREIYAYRLDQEFTNDEATWAYAETGVPWTGLANGAANASATTQYSINARRKLQASVSVGFRVSTATELDITELVKDAINRNNGTLLLWVGIPLSDVATTSGYAIVDSPSAVTATNRPKIETIVADRIVWDGAAGDGNAATATNWVGDVAPDFYDFLIFNDGAVDVTTGLLYGNSLFIGEGYTGTMENTNGDPIHFLVVVSSGHPEQNKMVINKKTGRFNLSASNGEIDTFIENTASEVPSEIQAFTEDTSTVYVSKNRNQLTLSDDGTDVRFKDIILSNDKNGSRNVVIDSVAEPPLKAAKSKVTVEKDVGNFILSNGTKLTVTNDGGSIGYLKNWIVGGSVVTHKGTDCEGSMNIANGRLTFNDNENGYIETEDIYLWKNGVFDPRTSVGAWSPTVPLFMRGGNFIVDVGRTLTIEN